MTHDTFTGVFPAMTTPFDDEERIDHETLRDHAQRLEAAGVDGLVPVGTTGESATMSHDEHIEVVETVVDAVDDVPVIAGSGSNNTREALELSERAADAGADGLLLISPYYNIPEPEGMETHYRTVADAVDLPQIIYNVPGRTGRNIAVETAVSLAEHENIVGYKAASGDLNRVGEVIERTREENFEVLSGDDALTLPIIAQGGTGCISVSANVEPERTVALVGAALEGDFTRARELQYELGDLFRTLFIETNPIPINEAMDMRDIHSSTMRSPLNPLQPEHREQLREVLADLER
ncbi:4-hydroxy-tetrahydrodipicolinate synthase [Natronomonas pharaonis DSM 2160]|uniref:4-hydroxy-tetrahydrodipicolinate synthase n=1 Tax=Natronomonas pharaonis (strain ATCC 35678 / DSM 2160 / CIP 103997 / JCM 8858 / NBRC 14720 / NCIMB 2260 / Gabara) TaxID=348780 RepID=DAPA_NATPD|nr:4-hydroxy-tetrahydrodipicolinate synthase [Natronomonas pharaonis]Q3ISQ0.1 RecName: Full=4-hydroxy-tetrahydrodipicolinate synthase; Short=HTPA synthase [Natronomonas pharaonis DSM 2160]CAI48836.1 4-hydroxy-tetrahydrodipicolinate synthase [Natronomonas pharaonis DSM 2160]